MIQSSQMLSVIKKSLFSKQNSKKYPLVKQKLIRIARKKSPTSIHTPPSDFSNITDVQKGK